MELLKSCVPLSVLITRFHGVSQMAMHLGQPAGIDKSYSSLKSINHLFSIIPCHSKCELKLGNSTFQKLKSSCLLKYRQINSGV